MTLGHDSSRAVEIAARTLAALQRLAEDPTDAEELDRVAACFEDAAAFIRDDLALKADCERSARNARVLAERCRRAIS